MTFNCKNVNSEFCHIFKINTAQLKAVILDRSRVSCKFQEGYSVISLMRKSIILLCTICRKEHLCPENNFNLKNLETTMQIYKMKLTIKMLHVLKPTSGRQLPQNKTYQLAAV